MLFYSSVSEAIVAGVWGNEEMKTGREGERREREKTCKRDRPDAVL